MTFIFPSCTESWTSSLDFYFNYHSILDDLADFPFPFSLSPSDIINISLHWTSHRYTIFVLLYLSLSTHPIHLSLDNFIELLALNCL